MTAAARNVTLYPWFRFFKELLFWQAVWFLYFQKSLSAAEAILLYAVYDVATTVLEVPSGWFSDRLGRRITLIISTLAGTIGVALLGLGDSFAVFVLGQALLGGSMAFASGTDAALLYESLEDCGQADRIEAEEVRAWRFGFTGLAMSAVTGGAMALWSYPLAFYASAVAQAGALIIAFRFAEPGARRDDIVQGGEWARIASIGTALRKPVLVWLFGLSVLMYGFSHIPFVFGQPYIQLALEPLGWSDEAPLVSGAVSTTMMLLSVVVSLRAKWLRARLGLAGLLLFAFALQIGLIAVLGATASALAIAVLFLRMVPDALSTPFIRARIQPELERRSRATFLSLKSLTGRVLFAGSLWLAAGSAGGVAELGFAEIRPILWTYAAVGLTALVALVLSSARIAIDPPTRR